METNRPTTDHRTECLKCRCYLDTTCTCAADCPLHPRATGSPGSFPPPLPTSSIRLGARVVDFIAGSNTFQNITAPAADLVKWAGSIATVTMILKLEAARPRRDGSITLWLTDLEQGALRAYVETMISGAAENTEDADGRAELVSGRAALRALDAAA